MRLFISVDMEGISGIEKVEECFRGMPGYEPVRWRVWLDGYRLNGKVLAPQLASRTTNRKCRVMRPCDLNI